MSMEKKSEGFTLFKMLEILEEKGHGDGQFARALRHALNSPHANASCVVVPASQGEWKDNREVAPQDPQKEPDEK